MLIVLPVLAVSPENQNLGPLEFFRSVNKAALPFPYSATVLFVGAWLIHLMEGFAALKIANSLGMKSKQSASWFWWTLLLGYPCMRWLIMLRSAHYNFSLAANF